MKQFASPGIDSDPSEQGIYNSGAGLHPDTVPNYKGATIGDWKPYSPDQGNMPGHLIANYSFTKSETADKMRVRIRGISPWGGYFGNLAGKNKYDSGSKDSRMNVGGSVDHNAGASAEIAGGSGAASSMVRIGGHKKANFGQKLPILPPASKRSGVAAVPTGGGSHGIPSAPLVPKITGVPSIVRIVAAQQAVKK